MPLIADVVRTVVAAPTPVLCLDTCDILEVVQCVSQDRSVAGIEAAQRLLAQLIATPHCVQLVITALVETEWNQNIDAVRQAASRHLAKLDAARQRIDETSGYMSLPLSPVHSFSASSLVADLVTLSRELLNLAIRLDLDDACQRRALQRVFDKRRPSHEGQVKDAIHLEHYLELARQLRGAGFAGTCVFVSSNKKDFWEGRPRIHPELEPELNDPAVRMLFYGSLDAALGSLGI